MDAFRYIGDDVLFILNIIIERPDVEEWAHYYTYCPSNGEIFLTNHECLFNPTDVDKMMAPLFVEHCEEVLPLQYMPEEAAVGLELVKKNYTKFDIKKEENSIFAYYNDLLIDGNQCYIYSILPSMYEKPKNYSKIAKAINSDEYYIFDEKIKDYELVIIE